MKYILLLFLLLASCSKAVIIYPDYFSSFDIAVDQAKMILECDSVAIDTLGNGAFKIIKQ